MSKITLNPCKYDGFISYCPESCVAKFISFYIFRYPSLKEIYDRSGVFAVLKEMFDNPALYSFDVGEVEEVVRHHDLDYRIAGNNGFLPEQLEDTIVRLIEQKQVPIEELTKEKAAELALDKIYDAVDDGSFYLDDLLFIYGIVGFPGLYNADDYTDDIRDMLEDAIDLDSIKKKLQECSDG